MHHLSNLPVSILLEKKNTKLASIHLITYSYFSCASVKSEMAFPSRSQSIPTPVAMALLAQLGSRCRLARPMVCFAPPRRRARQKASDEQPPPGHARQSCTQVFRQKKTTAGALAASAASGSFKQVLIRERSDTAFPSNGFLQPLPLGL